MTFAYQWLRDGDPISGETNQSYTVRDEDVGHAIACRVTATNLGGSDSANSRPVIVIGPPPPAATASASASASSATAATAPASSAATTATASSAAAAASSAAAASAAPPPPPPQRRCVVPRVVGLKLSAAERRIRVRHCRVGRVTRKFSTARQRNRVLKQGPKAGRRFAAGHKVTLVVGKGPRKR